MKLSLKLRDDTKENPLLRAKIPISILGFPFLSGITAGDASDLDFSLRTNFPSGPSLSLSYHPDVSIKAPNPSSATTAAATNSAIFPFSLSISSGIGLFGSPHDSPLKFTANFSIRQFNASTRALTPFFSLQIKPQFGNFSLRKSALSSSSGISFIQLSRARVKGELPNGAVENSEAATTFGQDRPLVWNDLRKVETFGHSHGILSGIFVAAKTTMPLTKRSVLNFRWGVNFESDNGHGSKITRPFLVLSKIGLERVEDAKRAVDKKKEIEVGELEIVKGMYGWMRKEMDELQKQNMDIKQVMESMRMQTPSLSTRGKGRDYGGKSSGNSSPVRQSSDNFEKWRSKKNDAHENGHVESKSVVNRASEMESELQKAFKAAAS